MPKGVGVSICGGVALKVFFQMLRRGICGVLMASAVEMGAAEAPRPVVGVGASRDEVLEAYGWPNGQSKLGEREIFTYAQGQVVLRRGVVERMEFSPNVEWPKPRPRPAAPTTSTAKPVVAEPVKMEPLDVWRTDFDEAREEAKRQVKDILVLFTGTDWSPPAKRFQAEVALAPEFLREVEEHHVLLRLDFPRSTTSQPAEVRERNEGLRERFGVTAYPTLIVLDAEGDELARVNLAKVRAEPTYVQQVLAAIEEARPKPKAIANWTEPDAATAEVSGQRVPRWIYWAAGGVLAVLALAGAMLRRRGAGAESKPAGPTVVTLPTPADVAGWSQERVRDVAAALFEHDGGRVKVRRTESGAELAVLPQEGEHPRALVRCQSAGAGLAGKLAVSALLGTAVAERVDAAWYVSAGGFTPDARQFAGEHGMRLISGEDLLDRLRKVPPLTLVRMLSGAGD